MQRLTVVTVACALTMAAPMAAMAFETPEEAVEGYLDGVAQADVAQVLEATAVQEMVEGYRLEQYVDYLGAFSPTMAGPVHDPFFADIEGVLMPARLLMQTRMLAYGLLAPETLADVVYGHEPVGGVFAAWAVDLMDELDTARLSGLEVVDIAVPVPEYYDSALDRLARRVEPLGADEGAERQALIEFEGKLYDVGFLLVRYGDDWRVAEPVGALAASVLWGAPRRTTIDRWNELTSE